MMLPAHLLSVSIARPPAEVYDFVVNPANLPRWATAFCRAVRQDGANWIIETPQGPVKIRFVARNELGVLDHYVEPAPGLETYVPLRVVANGSGSEVIFTLFRTPEMTDAKLAEDMSWVERDLATLKRVLET
jgi:uncharacterized protein YndB with AHSA1/START domain